MRPIARSLSSPITGVRVTALIIVWLGAVSLAAPALGLYYEALAVCYALPLLGLIYAYCASHRHRATALVAIVATVVTALAHRVRDRDPQGYGDMSRST